MTKNIEFMKADSAGATLFRGAVLAILTGSVTFVLMPQAIIRMLPLLRGQ